MPIGYHNRHPLHDTDARYFDSPLALAQWADFLIVACPGGPATRNLVNAEVLDALGPEGVLVNIARGSVVDTDALARALNQGRIAGAGIDAFVDEPGAPLALQQAPNIVMTPHMAGASPRSREAIVDLLLANLDAHFSGKPPITPIPG